MPAASRILAIGIDSAERTLLERYIRLGALPVLARLVGRAGLGVLRTPPGLGDDASWASFATALTPGRHGRYYHKFLETGSYRMPWFRDGHFTREPFWTALSAAGSRVGVLDVPKCPLAPVANGFQVADWFVHGRDGDTRSNPPGLAGDLIARFGDDRTDRPGVGDYLCGRHTLTADQSRLLLDHTLAGVAKKTDAACELLGEGGWDLFLVVFKEVHCAQHHFWDHVDPESPVHDEAVFATDRDPVLRVAGAVDAAIGRLLERSGPETRGLVFSDLGMATNRSGDHLIDEVLLRLEPDVPALVRNFYADGVRVEDKLRARFLPGRERSWMRGHRRAFRVEHNEMSSAIRINVRGREPSGRVEPGAEYDALVDGLGERLAALRHAGTRDPAVARVVRTRDEFAGERSDHLPDLFVVWSRDRQIEAVESDEVGVVRAPAPALRPGNHVENGCFVCFGPGAPDADAAGDVAIEDIGPTLASLLDTALPDVDGTPMAGWGG